MLKKSGRPITSIASSCELFMCFILTISSPKVDRFTMQEVKKIMTNRGQSFLKKLLGSRDVIARHADDFVTDGCRILTIGKSRVVYEALKLAASQNKHFHVYVTMSSIDNEGAQMVDELKKLNIDSTLILDASIGYIMEGIDFVFCGKSLKLLCWSLFINLWVIFGTFIEISQGHSWPHEYLSAFYSRTVHRM